MHTSQQKASLHQCLEAAKWIAIVSMTIDHYGKIFDPPFYLATHIIGRIAFPLFAWIIATRLALSPELGSRYLLRLLPWALVSQPVYMLVGHAWWDGNILITLALGVGVHLAINAIKRDRKIRVLALIVALLLPALFVDFGLVGVLMIPLIAQMATGGAWAAGPAGVLANASFTPPFLPFPAWFALLATPVALLSIQLRLRLYRLPTQLFYAYYPAHLLVLHLAEIQR